MAQSFVARAIELLNKWWDGFYQWLGITAGSLSDIPGNHLQYWKNIFRSRRTERGAEAR